jgi:hypothetical protein
MRQYLRLREVLDETALERDFPGAINALVERFPLDRVDREMIIESVWLETYKGILIQRRDNDDMYWVPQVESWLCFDELCEAGYRLPDQGETGIKEA